MTALRALLRRLRDDERGFSLPELTVAAIIGMATAATAMVMLQLGVRSEPQISEHSSQIQQGRSLVDRITRELRQGESVGGASASSLSMITYVKSATCGGAVAAVAIPCRVTYSCTPGSCTRTVRNPDGSGSSPAESMVTGIQGSSVFSYTPSSTDPSYVSVTLSFPSEDGAESVTVSDGASLRNHFGAVGA